MARGLQPYLSSSARPLDCGAAVRLPPTGPAPARPLTLRVCCLHAVAAARTGQAHHAR